MDNPIIADPTNITGISDLLNYDGEKDLALLEKSIIDDIDDTVEIDDVNMYKQSLEELGNSLGITLDDDDTSPVDLHNDDVLSERTSYSSGDARNHGYMPAPSSGHDVDDMFSRVPAYTPKHDSYMERVTDEQKKQRILNHVLADVDDNEFNSDSVNREREEDDKAILLEQIDMLMTNLKDEGVDVSRVPIVDSGSSIEDVKNVHKILRLKNDRNRYCSFAEEVILAGSHTLEWMFDGDKSYMGRKPDLRGWSATVNIKLRRMRYDTSTFVSELMQDYNLSHGTRIMFELIPSLFLFSKMKKSQHGDNLLTNDEMNSAMDHIRDCE
jgi:hypothetical protein